MRPSNFDSVKEIFQFTLLAHVSFMLRCSMLFLLRWRNVHLSQWLLLIVDFQTLVTPTLLCSTLLSDHISRVLLLLALTSAVVFCSIGWSRRNQRTPTPRWLKESWQDFIVFAIISIFRSYVLLSTCVCVLAVDLPIFPARFQKTKSFGFSLMDVGIGMIVFSNGLVSNAARWKPIKLARLIQKSAVLLFLGACRTMVLLYFDYPYDVEEYGMHWNFFYTLALVKLIGEFVASRLHVPYANAIVGVAIALAVQVFLQGEVQEYLFEEPTYREKGLLSLNREGIVSVVGCLAIFFIATDVGRLLYRCRRHRWNVAYIAKGIACLIIIMAVLCYGLDTYGLSPSRRIANSYYVFWIALLSLTDVFLLLTLTLIAFCFYYRNGLDTNVRTEDYYYLYDGSLWQAINASGLSYFLLCNVFTGIVKMSTSTVERMSVETSLAVIFCYALATSLFARSQWGHLEAIRWRRMD